ncbi:MAG TPA: outer membrane protein assembly factor BamA [Acetobacteraceae bacterium]|nr:outer membrane protein assembly factor BamA [Acetobacteraceae bacterium]
MSLGRSFAACLLSSVCTVSVAAQPALQAPSAPPAATPQTATPQTTTPQTTGPQTAGRQTTRPRPPAARPATPAPGGTIQAIQVEGNRRIEAGTVRSYMLVEPGDPFDPERLDRSLKTLYATGLFQDVQLSRQGSTLVVHVVENPLVSRVAFEGNHEVTDETLRPDTQLRAGAVYTPDLAEADRRHILGVYAQKGYYDASVTPEIIRLPQNRVTVVFEINEGASTDISKISFVGNHAFSQDRLSEVIDSREERWWRFLSTSDQYNPERLAYDKELLRRFYLKNGYTDFDVINASAELAPDRKSFFITFTVHEGERYRVAKIDINSRLRNLPGDLLRRDLKLDAGDWYDGDAVQRTQDAMEDDVRSRGYAFVNVRPRVDPDRANHTVALTFDVGEGPRVYIERIDIVGNTRTEDKVIRREFTLAEGDPFSAEAIRRTRQRLQDLQYFSTVDITPTQGSAPDKAILTTKVAEKATGELTFGGGYSTDVGPLLDVGLGEKNLVGSGIAANVNGILATKRSSIDLSVTDPYFLDRNLIAGGDVFLIQTDYLGTEPYDERREGFALRLGYDFNDHLRQVWSYSLVQRDVFDISTTASIFITDQAGSTLLSQVSQVLTLDYRDSKLDPHTGWVGQFGTDFAGLGGNVDYIRTSMNGAYYLPLDRLTGNSDWGIKFAAGGGYLFNEGKQEQIIDRFFLGGDNLRGFETGGAGPHDQTSGDPLGGRLIYTGTVELRYPLPVSPDLGLSGRAFVDVGGLADASFLTPCIEPSSAGVNAGRACQIESDNLTPRIGAGVGITWHSSFGLINIDLAPFVIKQPGDQTQIFRFGFGTQF